MKNLQNVILTLCLFPTLFTNSLNAQLSSPTVGPSNVQAMTNEIAFLYQNQLNIPLGLLKTFLHNPPEPVSNSGCTVPAPRITYQDDDQVRFSWDNPSQAEHSIRYINLETGSKGIVYSSSSSGGFTIENGLYLFLFQQNCGSNASAEYIIIDDKPVTMNEAQESENARKCVCNKYFNSGYADDFSTAILSDWPSYSDFFRKYIVEVEAYYEGSDLEGPPDVISSFAFEATGSEGGVDQILYLNACDENTNHDLTSIFSLDPGNMDDSEYGAFLQFTFSDGIQIDPLSSFYYGNIRIRRCNYVVAPNDGKIKNDTHFSAASPGTLRAFPNPTGAEMTLTYDLATEGMVQIQLLNAYGQLLRVAIQERQAAGAQQLALDLSGLPMGSYYCRLMHEEKAEGVWLIKGE